jgi:hypothetical protein
MANNSHGIFATNSVIGTNSVTGSSITAHTANNALVPYAAYDIHTDSVCGVPVYDWNRMSQGEQIHYARKWEERHRWEGERREMRFPTEPKETPVKSNPAGYLSNKTLLLLEI